MSFLGKLFGKKQDDESYVSPSQPAREAQVLQDAGVSFYPPGTRIDGRFEVVSRPLIGDMSIVYLCFDHNEQRPVALKTLKPEFLPDRAARDRFLRQGAVWVELGSHPHVVRCYGVERIGDGLEVYLILQLIAKAEGQADASLRSWLVPGRPLPVGQALLFALQIARGMVHATAVAPGLVHRDLKPENLLVGADTLTQAPGNWLRVTNFGLVRALGGGETVLPVGDHEWLAERPGLTWTGTTLGTPSYMAPEQWEGTDVDIRADIYALGCIVGEMVIGQMLIQENTLHGFRQAHQDGRAIQALSNLPRSLASLMDRCLALDPAARYGNWAEVEAALAAAYRVLTGRPDPALEPAAVVSRADRVTTGWSYSDMGVSYLHLGHAESARGYFERARATGAAEGERQLEAAGLTHLGLAYAHMGDARRAIEYHQQALKISREIGDRQGEGIKLGNLGGAYTQLGDAQRAMDCNKQALAIAREIGGRQDEENALRGLGIAYFQLGDARRAIEYHQQALKISREIGDRRGEGNALSDLGNACADLGETRRAIGYHEKALAVHSEIGDLLGEGADLGNLGNAYANLGETRRAIEYQQQALKISREIGDVLNASMRSANLAMSFAQVGRTGEAVSLIEQAIRDFRQAGYPQQAQQAERMLAQIRAGLR